MSKVTVAITTTGRPHFLRTALQSVRNQLALSAIAEVIVSENSGDSRTEAVCADFPDLPIRYLFRQPNLPMLAHLFSTYGEARSSYIAILNDDDWWTAGHLADALRLLDADPGAVAYAAASLFVSDEVQKNPRWIDRSAALWMQAGQPSWLTTWKLDLDRMLAACWVYTPFHWSSLVARTGSLAGVLDELCDASYYTHTIDRLVFAHLAVAGSFLYNPVPDTFVRWHAGNWVKTHAAPEINQVLRATVQRVERLAARHGLNVIEMWQAALGCMPSEFEAEILDRFSEAFRSVDLQAAGLARFFHRRRGSSRLMALRGIAVNTKRLLVGC
jgi:hypothetical protein